MPEMTPRELEIVRLRIKATGGEIVHARKRRYPHSHTMGFYCSRYGVHNGKEYNVAYAKRVDDTLRIQYVNTASGKDEWIGDDVLDCIEASRWATTELNDALEYFETNLAGGLEEMKMHKTSADVLRAVRIIKALQNERDALWQKFLENGGSTLSPNRSTATTDTAGQ